MINSILLILFGNLYGKLMKWMVRDENHRYVYESENSMTNKIYMFQFLNTYIGNFVAIWYNQSFVSLSTNLFIVMVFKQLFMNLKEYLSEMISVGGKIREVEELFAPRIEAAKLENDEISVADLKMHCEI